MSDDYSDDSDSGRASTHSGSSLRLEDLRRVMRWETLALVALLFVLAIIFA
ncbi:hypothetical protein AB0I10_04080 [Streptomyces sp. NPDC050636]|uniref:hypothetical protein n=1 Tax=Streptomyces sp. NPDC050636 TaxID=3154510 RepID=UPI00343761D8